MQLNSLMDDLTKKRVLGTCMTHISVVKQQKQRLTHCHILLISSSDCKPSGPSDYDNIVSAEIPDPDRHPGAYTTVTRNMMWSGLSRFTLHGKRLLFQALSKNIYPGNY
ncbi:hypothetical protein INT45_003832 [Circinella minor]|uniref:Helitron helicase-like domain-containing protein n=1 Tax=Circinella minor TaxID=1195481 RepID=A0A8H7SD39_9FUNG|nr:hypothetical protein INT45_003832 [Circinella minor]